MGEPIRVFTNPVDPAEYVIVWSDGFMSGSNASALQQLIYQEMTWYATQPPSPNVATYYGGMSEIVAAAIRTFGISMAGWHVSAHNLVLGFGGAGDATVSVPYAWYIVDAVFGPSGTSGYALLKNGDVKAFGGAPAVAHGPFLSGVTATHLRMDWTSKRYWVFDKSGKIWGKNGGNDVVHTLPNDGSGLYWAGAVFYDTSTADPVGWVQDRRGRIVAVNGAEAPKGYKVSTGYGTVIDLNVLDDGTGPTPLQLRQLLSSGQVFDFTSSTNPIVRVTDPVSPQDVTTRPLIRWGYDDPEGDPQKAWQARVVTDAVFLAGGTDEVQRVTITGTPTGGTFTLSFMGEETEPIAYNASAATVAAALEALSVIGTGNVVCSGGPLPGSFVVCTFAVRLAAANLAEMTADGSLLTGGTAPAVAVTTTTAGVGVDPGAVAAVWEASGTGEFDRQVQIDDELPNDVYRAYVRALDVTDLWSDWHWQQWTQNHAPPAVPSVTRVAQSGVAAVDVTVHVEPAGLHASARLLVQYQDEDSATWEWVRDAYDLDPDASGNYTVTDPEPRFGVARTYRALTYIYNADTDIWSASAWSTPFVHTLEGDGGQWVLSAPEHGVEFVVRVREFEPSREASGGVFYPLGRTTAVVVSGGVPKAPTFDLDLWLLDRATREQIDALLALDTTLLLRDAFGRAFYFRIVGDVEQPVILARPTAGETTKIRDAHEFSAPAISVRRPIAGMTVGPIAET